MFTIDCGEIAVCETCAYFNEYGETPDSQDGPAPLALIPFGYTMTAGGVHRDGCTDDGACACDDLGFHWSTCDACGDLAGNRYRYTLWRLSHDEARAAFDRAVTAAYWARQWEALIPRDGNGETFDALSVAAQYRRYLAFIAREARQHAAWMARNGVAA
jgi:hypothetical protein